ncbi:MAG: hypothetical protein J0M09_15980 [Xanthomonadales bacterium]|nr:hypothetical protein [Xanthomonadales bacterium]
MDVESARIQIAARHRREDMAAWITANRGQTVNGEPSKSMAEAVQGALRRNRRAEAAAVVLAHAMAAGDKVVATLRQHGVLRASRYRFHPGGPREIASLLLLLHGELKLSDHSIRYLESLLTLYNVADRAHGMRRQLLDRMKARKGKALKTFLALANHVFAYGHDQDIEAPSDEAAHYSKEDISEAVSRLVAFYREEFGIVKSDWIYTDPQALNKFNGTYSQDLFDALRLNQLIKAEMLLDGLPYEATIADGRIVMRSIDPSIEKSVRLGYIQMDAQVMGRQLELLEFWEENGEPGSLIQICEHCFDKGLNRLAHVRPKPFPRVALAIPTSPEFFEPFASERYFKEDILGLVQLGVNSYDDLGTKHFEVAKGVRSIDMFKVNRLFTLLFYAMQRAITAQPTEMQRTLTLHSSVLAMQRAEFMGLLSNILPSEVAQRIFDLLKFDSSRDHVDLQYTPFIVAGDFVVAAPALVAMSNLVRNVACANQLQENRIVGADPMQRAVVDALRQRGFTVAEEVGLQGKDHDVDILAYRDGCLYAFECKNAYHPCNAHELRNSFGHIQKAGRQLALREAWLAQRENLTGLFAKLGWALSQPHTIRTGILTANRLFTGARIEHHPVRQAHEFINVVLRGHIRSNDGKVYEFWKDEELTTDDLNNYLDDSGLLADHFEALKPINYDYDFDGIVLRFESWRTDPEEQQAIFNRRYRVREAEQTTA